MPWHGMISRVRYGYPLLNMRDTLFLQNTVWMLWSVVFMRKLHELCREQVMEGRGSRVSYYPSLSSHCREAYRAGP